MAKIHILQNDVVSLIAAGEVVQRPASVVKELLENALDAGAKNIQLSFEEGGKALIQVMDDGSGMDREDVPLCIQRHATSKIRAKEDLEHIGSYGFRGEAMHAIATVAELEIMTRRKEDEVGFRVVVEEGEIKEQEEVSMPKGTQITVRYLFRNLPGRRNFLKSDALEGKHIIDEFQRVALARPDVGLTLYQNKVQVYQLPATKLSHRIVHLFGKHYEKGLIPCEEYAGSLQVHGYIGSPAQAKKSRGGQFFFVNNRFIKSSYLHHAVKKAFDTLIADDYIPFYVIFIEVPLEKVDVNVHPHKTEVRFEEEKLLYLLMTTSLRKALATHHCMHTIDFEGAGTKAIFEGQEETAPMEPIEMPATPIAEVPRIFPMDNHEDSFFIPFNADKKAVERDKQASTTDAFGKGKESFFLANGRDNHVAKTSAIHNLSITFQLHGKYICTQAKSGLLIINQRRAYERILYERNMKLLDLRETQSQKLLFPQKISLQPADMTLLKGCKDTLYQLGFRFVLHDDHIVVTGHPVDALHQRNSNENLLLGLLEQYKMQTDVSFENEKWAISLAKRSNLPEGSTLLPQEINSIIDQLFACKNPTYTLEGKAIWQVIPMEQIDAWIDKG